MHISYGQYVMSIDCTSPENRTLSFSTLASDRPYVTCKSAQSSEDVVENAP